MPGSAVSFAAVESRVGGASGLNARRGKLNIERATTDKISARPTAGVGTGGDTMVVLQQGELRVQNTACRRAPATRLCCLWTSRICASSLPGASCLTARRRGSEADRSLTETPLLARPYRPGATKLREIALERTCPATFALPSDARASARVYPRRAALAHARHRGRIPRCSAS